jgi:hypothetical protein
VWTERDGGREREGERGREREREGGRGREREAESVMTGEVQRACSAAILQRGCEPHPSLGPYLDNNTLTFIRKEFQFKKLLAPKFTTQHHLY